MNFYDALKKAAAKRGRSILSIEEGMGRTHGYIAGAMSRGSLPKIDNASKMMDEIGYVIVAMPKEVSLPKEAIAISGEYFADRKAQLEMRAKRHEEQARKLRRQIRG